MPTHPTRGLIRALSTLLERARACWMSALALYLAKPVDEFSMLTTADQAGARHGAASWRTCC